MNNSAYLNQDIEIEQYANAVLNLMKFALKDCGGSKVCAQVLLSAYNGTNFQLDITDLCLLHGDLYGDAITVIRARNELNTEPHLLIEDGDRVFNDLQKQWSSYHVKKRHNRKGG